MNPRIRELMNQAVFTDQIPYPAQEQVFQKFAELLVRECAQFVEDTFDFVGEEIIVKEKMLDHFGVEP